MRRFLLLALLLLASAAHANELHPFMGIWVNEGRLGRTTVAFAADGNWTYRFEGPDAYEESYGAWSIPEKSKLEIRLQDKRMVRYSFHELGPRRLDLVDAKGTRVRLTRTRDPIPATATPASVLASPFENRPVKPRLRHWKPSATGHILYTRVEVVKGALAPRIHIMDGDGRRQAPFIAPQGAWTANDPVWSPDGKKIAFSSNYEMPRSALYQDVFLADLESGRTCRITGNEIFPVAVKMESHLELTFFMQDPKKRPWDFAFSAQGHGLVLLNRDTWVKDILCWKTRFDNVHTGRSFWLKCWCGKHRGDLRILEILKPTTEEEPHRFKMKSGTGTVLVGRPHFTPDGKRLVCTWHRAFFRTARKTEPPTDPLGLLDEQQRKDREAEKAREKKRLMGSRALEEGADTIAIVDIRKGSPPVFEWNPAASGGQPIRSATLSPNGAWLAFEVGQIATQSLAVMSMDDFVHRRGGKMRLFAQGGARVMKGHESFSDPAWSPDGRHIVFCRHFMDMHSALSGELRLLEAESGRITTLLRFTALEIPSRPCWSPDGSKIAFALVKGKGRTLTLLDLARLHITSDIAVIGKDGAGLRKLTTDGRSGAPAWGP